MAREIKIAIMGLGVVGGGVYKILNENRSLIESRLYRNVQEEVSIRLKRIFGRRAPAQQELQSLFTDKFDDLLQDVEIDVVIETMGGIEPTTQYVESLLKAKKHVISANKAMIATAQGALEDLARQYGVQFLYEAAVGGTIPILQAIRDGLVANDIRSIRGIVNGTTNYILSAMYNDGKSFEEVLKQAQELGFAEADPSSDVDGYDAMYKLAILCYTAFGEYPSLDTVKRESLRDVSMEQLQAAKKEGAKLKYIASADRLQDGSLELSVKLTKIQQKDMLYTVDGVLNAVALRCDRAGDVFFSGAGAGSEPTASAVISDLIKVIAEL